MKKKIIIVSTALWIGGIESALVNLLRNFDYEKYEVTCLIIKAELDLIDQIDSRCELIIVDREKSYSFKQEYKYRRLFHLTEKAENPSFLHRCFMWCTPAIRWIENALYISYIRQQMQDREFDTAIIYSDVVSELVIKAINADKFLMFYHHGAMRRVYHDSLAYKKCDSIIAVSEYQAGLLKEFVPKAKNKIVTIHNLLDVEGIRKKANMSLDVSFEDGLINIVSVGRVSHEKGMDIAVLACEKLIQSGYENFHWWIVGDGPAMNEVREVIRETNVEKYVSLLGMKENPYPFIKNADIYVQPSRFEGYPMTLLESLLLGNPVISTNNNGAREILDDMVTGILTETDANSIASAIGNVIDNPYIWNMFKENIAQMNFIALNKKYFENLELIL